MVDQACSSYASLPVNYTHATLRSTIIYSCENSLAGRALSKCIFKKNRYQQPCSMWTSFTVAPIFVPTPPLPVICVSLPPHHLSLSPCVSLSFHSSLSPFSQPSPFLSVQAAVAPSPAGLLTMFASRVSIPVRAGKTERPSSPAQSSQLVSRTVLPARCNALLANENVCACYVRHQSQANGCQADVSITQQQMRYSCCRSFP